MLWWTLRKLKSKDFDRRIAAVEELADSKDPRAIPPLVAALRDKDAGVRQAAAQALTALGWKPANDTQRAERAVASQDWSEAVSLGRAAVEPLVAALRDRNSLVWGGMVEALTKLGDAAVEALVAALKDKDWNVPYLAAKALEKIKRARAAEPLQPQGARGVGPLQRLGILFDIDELGGGLYGYAAYKILFDAIDTRQIPGCSLSDGDADATLAGRANQYCIAVEALDSSKIAAVRNTLGTWNAKGPLPPPSRFLNDEQVRREPLVLTARINTAGELVDCKTGWATQAWKESREKHAGSSPTGNPGGSVPEWRC